MGHGVHTRDGFEIMDDNKTKEIPGESEELDPQGTQAAAENGDDPDEVAEEQVVDTLLERIAELEDKRQRALADAENVRRRAERQQAEAIVYANTAFARDLLSVSDNLERALEAGAGDQSSEGIVAFVEGVEMTQRELQGVLEKNGVSRIESLGDKFDHNFHQAMGEIDHPEAKPGTIVEVIQPGYLLRDRLLRPAMVLVSKGAKDGDTEAG
jgi:molecular chaperone GrpE